jgi:hypothetical protein
LRVTLFLYWDAICALCLLQRLWSPFLYYVK